MSELAEHSASRGFTLIEVLLALALMGLAMFALVAATARALSVVPAARLYSETREWYERIRLEYPLEYRDGQVEGELSGSFEVPAPAEVRWERTVEPFFKETDEPLVWVRTRIFARNHGRDVVEEFIELAWPPGW